MCLFEKHVQTLVKVCKGLEPRVQNTSMFVKKARLRLIFRQLWVALKLEEELLLVYKQSFVCQGHPFLSYFAFKIVLHTSMSGVAK